jgi:hypothetical protein
MERNRSKGLFLLLILLVDFFTVHTVCALEKTDNKPFSKTLKGEYLGQKPPVMVPEIFATGLVSTENGWEAAVSFSPDGQYIFYNSNRPKPSEVSAQGEIWYSEKTLADGVNGITCQRQ